MTTPVTYGSLCSGYDGIAMGLEAAGVALDRRFHAETETSVAKVLSPDVPNLGDIKVADFTSAPRVEIMSSGDPCQSISLAGRREGRKDPRFLWPWVREAYRALQPRVIFLENVLGMTGHDGGRTMAERFEHLRADGYAVRWTVLGACAVGAPHHRHRWFALAVRSEGTPAAAERIGAKAWCGAPRSGGRLLLPTPAATRSGNNRGGSAGREGQPVRHSLDQIHKLLPTPRATGVDWGDYAEAVALWEQVTGVSAPAPTIPGRGDTVRLNPELPEWMMGVPSGLLTQNMGRNDALRAAGNGAVPLAVAAAWRMLASDGFLSLA